MTYRHDSTSVSPVHLCHADSNNGPLVAYMIDCTKINKFIRLEPVILMLQRPTTHYTIL